MAVLGACYLQGLGTQVDEKKAFEWLKKASDLGHAQSMNMLADCYEKGVGTKQDFDEAFFYYKKSVDLGNKEALLGLSNCYLNGTGTLQDDEKYRELFGEYIKYKKENRT